MTLLRIGGRYINFDLVRYVDEDKANGVRIFFSSANGEVEILQLGGEEAAALKQWLRRNSTEVKPLPTNWRHTPRASVEAGR